MESLIDGLKNNGFATVDYIIVLAYLALLIFLGFYISRNKGGKEKSSNDYFLAGNSLTWWAVGASLIAANISAEQFIGMSGSAYASGIAIAAYELMAACTLILVGKFLLPIMIKKKIFTIPQFLRQRYNNGVGLSFSIFWLFLYVFVNLTSVAWLGALAIEQILGIPSEFRMWIILALFVIAGTYSIYGGLASVAWTDVMQVVFLIGGGLITAWFALKAIAPHIGADGPIAALGNVMGRLGDISGDTHFHLIVERNADLYPVINGVKESGVEIQKADPFFTIPGLVVIFGALWLTNIGYWGFNQYIIQKGLAAKSIEEAKKGLIFAGFLKILIPFIVCIPGVCAYLIWNDAELHNSMVGSLSGSIKIADDAYPFLIRNFTPVVVKGLSFAALTAAVISSLASMFNSTSTLFTMDIYKEIINKKATEKQLVKVGRITAVVALMIAFICVKPLLGGLDQAFQFIQEYSGFVYPGICVVFGLGLLWKRASSSAAIWTSIATFPLGILLKIIMPHTPFLLRMGYVFMILAAMFIIISLYSKQTVDVKLPSEKNIRTMKRWGRIFLVSGISFAAAGIIQKIVNALADSPIYLERIGFEAIFFLAAMLIVLAIYLFSNAKDQVEDPKSVGVHLELFRTDKAFDIGAWLIVILLAVLYIALW